MIFLSDEDTLPPREWNVSIDVNSMTLSLGHVSTPSSCPHQSHLVSLLGKEYWEENGDFRCIYGKDHRETQEGGKLRDGKTLTVSLC